MTRTDDIRKLIQNWETDLGVVLTPEQRKKLSERIEKLAQEEFKTGMEYRKLRVK